MDTCHYVLLTGYLATPLIHLLLFILLEESQCRRTLLFTVSWKKPREQLWKCLQFLSQEKWVESTSVFSWLGSILLKYCLFWAQTQNTSVSDGLGKQINKQANIDFSFMFVDMCHMCLLFMPNKSNKIYLPSCVCVCI